MSTSGVTTYTYDRDQYANAILRKIGVTSRFDAAEPEDIEETVEAMNLFLPLMNRRSDGAPNAKFWLRKTGALILSAGKNRYALGGSGSDLAVPLDTLIIRSILNASSLTASTTSLDTTIPETFTLLHNAAIHYNDAGIFTSAISNYSASGNLLNQPDFSAAGTWVLGTGWAIAAGVAACDGTQVAVSNLSQTSVLTSGTRYLVLTNISAYTSGTLTPITGSTRGDTIDETGWNLQFLTGSGTSMLWEASENFIGSVTSVVVIPLTGTLTLTLTTPFNRPATSASEVFFYTDTIDKPLDVLTMNRRDRNGGTGPGDQSDSPMQRYNQDQYEAVPDKSTEGDPTAYYFEPKLTDGYLYVDSVSTDFRDILVFKYLPPIQVFTASSDDLDIPDIGRECLIYNVAKRMAGEHGKKWSKENEEIRQEATGIFMNSDPDTARMFFEPERVDFGEGSGSYYS